MNPNHARTFTASLAVAALAALAAVPVGARAAEAGTLPTASIAFTSDVAAAAPAPTPTTNGGCRACTIANAALPWLALVVDPSIVWDVITGFLATAGGIIASIFGF
jgi:hypothetical protein